MPKHDLSSRHLQRKISEFCEVRIAPISSKRVLENVRPYLVSLIIYRKRPPVLNGRLDWTAIGEACGIEDEMTADLKKQLRPALDAIMRWLKVPPVADDIPPAKLRTHASKVEPVKQPTAASSTRQPQRAATDGVFVRNKSTQRGPAPKPISPFPDALFEATDDPARFQDALIYHMRRFGDSYWQLYRAVVRLTETFDSKTLLSWIQGERVPRSVASFDILRRIETRYRLSEGYFKAKLPHQARSLYGHDLGDISPAERRRISLHLPDDFSSLPLTKREEILDWVRRVIVSGSTEYRRYQAARSKEQGALCDPFSRRDIWRRFAVTSISNLRRQCQPEYRRRTRRSGSAVWRRRCAATAGHGNGRSHTVQDLNADGDRLPAKWRLGRGDRIAEDRTSRPDVWRTRCLPFRHR